MTKRNLTAAYDAYTAHADADTLNQLLREVTSYSRTFAIHRRQTNPEDLAQEITIKVWQSLGKYRAKASFKTFVHSVATHHMLDMIRAGRRKPTHVQTEDPVEPDHPVVSSVEYSAELLTGLGCDELAVLDLFMRTMGSRAEI